MIRRLFKDFAVYGIGDLLLKAISIFTFPIYTRLFTVEQYGILNTVATVTGLASAILVLGSDSAYARYFFDAEDDEGRQTVTSTALLSVSVWSLAAAMVLTFLSRKISSWTFETPEFATLFTLSLASIPLTLANSICAQALRNQFRASLFSALNAATVVLTIVLTLVCVLVLNLGLSGVLTGGLIAAGIILPIRLWFIRDLIRLRFSADLLGKLLSYGLPLVPTSLAYWVFTGSDRIVLSKLSTLEQVGLYSVANQMCMIGAFLYNALGQAWSPHAMEIYSKDEKKASEFFGQVMTFILVGFGIFAVGISAFAREALLLLATPEFVGAAAAVAPLALGFVAYATTQVTGIGISLKKKTYYFAVFAWLAAILNVVLNIVTVPSGGMIASAWATAAAYTFLTIAYFFVAQRLFFVKYQTAAIAFLIPLIISFSALTYWIPVIDSLVVAIGLKALYVIVFCVCCVSGLALVSPQSLNGLSIAKIRQALSGEAQENKV